MADRTVLPPIGPGGMLSQSYTSQDSRPSSRSSTTSTAYTWAPPPSADEIGESQDHHGFYRANNRSTTRSNNGRVVKLPAINKGKNGPGISHASSVKTLDRLGSSLHTPRGNRWRDPAGFVRYSADEDCLKCMLGVPHKKCEAHKYIRVGGGYRHSYWHVKAMLLEIEFKHKYIRVGGGYRHSYWYVKAVIEELEFQRQQEIMRQQRLEAIQEKTVHAVKTYIRTKSGRLVERIIFMSDEDYKAFQKAQKEGGDPTEFLKKYLSKEDAKNLDSYDKEEQRAIKTFIRTKSGRLIEKLVYVSKSDYEAMKRGDVDANTLLKKHMKLEDGETIEGWGEAKMRTITTKIRTKSGRIIEKTIQISEEDYQRMMKGGKDVQDEILRKYMKVEEGEEIAGWEKPKSTAMKVVKTYIRTKSGRLIEKTILMTEDEFAEFQKSGGDVNFLKKFIKLEQGEEIENWEKASTVYSASDDEETLAKMKPGTRVRGKDGELYEYVVDPITGKMFKKKVARADSDDSGIGSINKGRFTKKGANGMAEIDEEAYKKHKAGKRMEGSDSEYSYKSFMSDGGTRHVQRRKKLAGGRRGSAHSYHSSEDEEGAARRRRRRRAREHGADSAHSYYSVVSEGGTRRVRRKKKLPGGGYAKSESYHSDTSEKIKAQKRKKKRGRDHGADSDHSYYSEVSAGGTHHRKRRQRIRDKQGNVIGYGKTENYTSSEDEGIGGAGGKGKGKGKKGGKGKAGDADSDVSYFSEVSAGGTRHQKKRKRIRDADGKVVGYGKAQEVTSEDEGKGKKGKKKGRKEHGADSDHSYFSEVSEGGTKHRKRRARIRDKDGKVIGYGKAQDYSSSGDEGNGKKKKKKGRREHGADSDHSYFSEVSAGGTRTRKRRARIRDKDGKVIGHGKAENYSSSEGEGGKKKKKKKKHGDDSDHSYYSEVSAGGTRTRKRRARIRDKDGKVIGHGKAENYSSSEGEGGKKKKKKRREHGADSDHSYYSEVSAGGTRTRKRRARIRDKDGNVIGHGEVENYTSPSEDEGGKKKKKERVHGPDSAHSYFSETSEGGTRRRFRKEKIRDKDGNVVGYKERQRYSSPSDDEDGKRKKKKKRGGPDSDHSYYSEVSAGGTRRVMKKKRIRDAQGKVIGHGKAEIASDSDSDSFISVSDGKGGKVRIRKQRGKEQAGHWKGETPVFSDATTDSDIVAEKLKNMTEEEKKVYLAEREARKAEREAKRKEKYGDKYDEMVEKNKQAKLVKEARKKYENEKAEAAAKAKSMVTYGKGRGRMGSQDMDDRGIGLAHEDWGKTKGKGKKGKDGHEADGEGDDGEYGEGRKKKGRKGSGASSFSGESVWSVDADGNKIKKKIKMKGGKRYEYTYDAKGNLIKKKEVDDASSDGDYFEIDPVTGEVRLKAGKAKIDIKKLTDADLRRLGIDPTLPKSEIKRLLMEKFGKDIDIVDRGKKIGMKTLADYGSDVNTDDLANDSDFDVTTLRGTRKVNVKMRRGGQALLDHLKRIIEDSKLKSDYANDLDERDGDIDYLAHYRLVDAGKVEMYAKAFVVEDEDFDAALSYKELRFGLDGVPTVQHLTKKQMEYVFKVLKLDDASQVTFKMFAVISALCERVTQMDPYCKHLLEISNLLDIERKMDLYKAMFYCNTSADRDANFITSESLKIELIAGGLNWKQQEFIMDKMMPNKFREINFLDYMCYIPLFLSMHENICDNPLDMSDGKYSGMLRRHSIQRDMNPLGYQMHNSTAFILRKKAHDLLEGKVKADITKENMELLEKYSKLPSMIGATKQGATDTPGTNSKQKKEDDWSTNIFANDDFDDK